MRFARVLASLVLFGVSCGSLRAQTSSTATVLGRVTDSTGGVVPGAQITLRNEATNASREQTTNSYGQYVFSAVDPGRYSLTVMKDGFQTESIGNVLLDVNTSYTRDIQLKVGATTTSVEVTSEAAITLQTTDATIGSVISGDDIVRLPTQSRNATELLSLQPGAAPPVYANSLDKGIGSTGGGVAGARADQNATSLDGIDVTLNAASSADFTPVFPLSVEAISEFRVGITNPNSSFGIAGGGQESVASRAGTNNFHGVGYWYNQNTVFNANEWGNKLTGLKRPGINDNRVGVSVGGPIQKDRTFFFANYEVRRYSQSIRSEQNVPSQNLRNGIVTFNGTQYHLKDYDPRGIGISPTIQKYWNLYPAGNDSGAGDGVNILGYLQSIPAPLKDDTVSLRLDHHFSSSLHFFARYEYSRDLNPAALGQYDLRPAAANPGTARFLGNQATRGDGITMGLDWILRPTLINSVHVGWIRSRLAAEAVRGDALATQFNLPGTGSLDGPVFLEVGNFNAFTLNLNVPVNDGAPSYEIDSTNYQFRDDLNWTKGTHTFAFGGNVIVLPTYERNDHKAFGPGDFPIAQIVADQNVLTLTNSADRPAGVPATAWDLMYATALGMVDSTTNLLVRDSNLNPLAATTPITEHLMQRAYYFYAQDTWRMRPSLTLSYGLSYGWQRPPTERDGRLMTLVDANGKSIDSGTYLQNVQNAALLGQVYNQTFYHLPYAKAGMSGYWNTDWSDVAPRVSIAWSPASGGFLGKVLGEKKTVIRGGYGIVYDRPYFPRNAIAGAGFSSALSLPTPQCNDPVAVPGPNCNINPSDPAATAFRVGIDGPNIPMQPPGTKLTLPYAAGVPGSPAEFWDYEVDPNYKMGRSHMFDFSVQRQLPGNNLIEVGYVGRLARRLPNNWSLSSPPIMFKDVASGQSFAQAFDAVATAVRNGTAIPTAPWFEHQLPAGWGASSAGCNMAGVTNSQCVANQFNQDFLFGNLQDLFGVAGFGGIDGIRTAGGLPSLINTQTFDLMVHESHDLSNYNALTFTWHNGGLRGLNFDVNYTFSKSLDNGGRPEIFPNGANSAFNPMVDYGPSYFDRTHTFNGTFNYNLPFGRGHLLSNSKALNRVIGGWYLGGIFTASTGLPQLAAESFAYGGGPVTVNPTGEIPTVDPSSFGAGVHQGVSGTMCNGVLWGPQSGTGVDLFADPGKVACSFRPVLLASDNRNGRNKPFRGFGNWNLDTRLGKETSITERIKAELSADFFNVFNHVVYNDPGASASQGGLDLTSPGNFGVTSSQAIPGNRIAGARWVELGLRISF
jgi:hypothetical protein